MATIQDFWNEVDSRVDERIEARLEVIGFSSSGPVGTPTPTAGGLPIHNNLHHEPDLAIASDLTAHIATIASAGTLGHIRIGSGLSIDGSGIVSVSTTGLIDFLDLGDVDAPVGYVGQADKVVIVKSDESGLEFHTLTASDVGALTQAVADTLYDPINAASDAIAAHLLAADPHPQYLTAAEGDALFLTPAEGNAAYVALSSVSAFGFTLIDDANAAAARATLELVAGATGDIWVEKAGDTMTGALIVQNDLTIPDAFFVSDSLNRVGIRTVTPQQPLDVVGTMQSRQYGSAPSIRVSRGNTSEASPSRVLSGDTIGQIAFLGYEDGTDTFAAGTDFIGVATADFTSANVPTELRIRVNTGSGLTTRVTINTAVLIGKSSGLTGAGDLDVQGNTRLTGNIGFYNTTPVAKPTVTGSRAGNAALASLLTALSGQGLITNSSTA